MLHKLRLEPEVALGNRRERLLVTTLAQLVVQPLERAPDLCETAGAAFAGRIVAHNGVHHIHFLLSLTRHKLLVARALLRHLVPDPKPAETDVDLE